MKKRTYTSILSILLCMTLFLSACGAAAPMEEPVAEETQEEETTVLEEPAGEETEETSDEPELFPWPHASSEEDAGVLTDDDLMNLALSGTVYTFTGDHPNGDKIEAVGLSLTNPVTIDTEYTGRVVVDEVQLAAGSSLEDGTLQEYDGMEVVVYGKGFGAHTAWHLRDLVMLVDEIYEDYEEDWWSDYEYISNINDFDLGYYLDVGTKEDVYSLLNGRWYLERDYASDGTVTVTNATPDVLAYYDFDAAGNASFSMGVAADAGEDGELPQKDTHKLTSEVVLSPPEDVSVSWPTSWHIHLKGNAGTVGGDVFVTHRGKYLYVYEESKDGDYREQVFSRNTTTSGEKMSMNKDVQREANLFLSNFAEQSRGGFSYNGSFDMSTLVEFAFAFARVNTPEQIVNVDGYESLTLDQVNTFMLRYTPFFIPDAETPYVDRSSFYYDENTDRIYHSTPGQEDYNFIAIATGMERGQGRVRFIDYDVYELDYVEYRAQGIDKAYYEMTATEAAANSSLTKVCSGRAVAETFTTPSRESFRMISNESIYRVTNVEELMEAIGSYRTIELAKGQYDVTNGTESFMIESCTGFILKAAPGAEGEVEIVTSSPYANVIDFKNCESFYVEGIVCGHIIEEGDCGGNVIGFDECYNVNLNKMDLYGCGAYGYQAWNSSGITMTDSVIHDCTYGCISNYESYGLYFENCVFRDCRQFTMLDLDGAYGTFKNCKFYGLEGEFLSSYEEQYVTFEGCLFDKAVLEALEAYPYLDCLTMIP